MSPVRPSRTMAFRRAVGAASERNAGERTSRAIRFMLAMDYQLSGHRLIRRSCAFEAATFRMSKDEREETDRGEPCNTDS